MEKTFLFRGELVNLEDDKVRLDFDSPLEFALVAIAVFSSFFIVLIPLTLISIRWIAVPIVLFLGSLALRYGLDCTYIVDNKQKRIDYSRSIFGSESVETICKFDEINCVTVNGLFIPPSRNRAADGVDSTGYLYNVVIVTSDGKIISATENEGHVIEKADKTAQMFAEHFGAPFIKGQDKSRVIVSYHPTSGEVAVSFQSLTP